MNYMFSMEKSSLWRAGNSRSGCCDLNFASASMCKALKSLKSVNFAMRMSNARTSPLYGSLWVWSSSYFKALSIAWFRVCTSKTLLSPGRSEKRKRKEINITDNNCKSAKYQTSLEHEICR